MKPRTKVLAWVWIAWLVFSVYDTVAASRETWSVAIRMGLLWPLVAALLAALVPLTGAIALLRCRPWGWWVLAVCAGLGVIAYGLYALADWVDASESHVPASTFADPLQLLAAALNVAGFVLLVTDPPRRWLTKLQEQESQS